MDGIAGISARIAQIQALVAPPQASVTAARPRPARPRRRSRRRSPTRSPRRPAAGPTAPAPAAAERRRRARRARALRQRADPRVGAAEGRRHRGEALGARRAEARAAHGRGSQGRRADRHHRLLPLVRGAGGRRRSARACTARAASRRSRAPASTAGAWRPTSSSTPQARAGCARTAASTGSSRTPPASPGTGRSAREPGARRTCRRSTHGRHRATAQVRGRPADRWVIRAHGWARRPTRPQQGDQGRVEP